MTFETKEQVLEKILSQDKPKCKHCDMEMNIWEVPPFTFSDGLGWGVPYLFICFNDDCPAYVQGWENIQENYSHNASYRCMCYPGSNQYEYIPVFSPMGAQGQIIDEQALAQQEVLKEAIKRGFSVLAGCYVSKDSPEVLRILLDSTEPMRVRLKAAEMMGDLGDIGAIEPLRNLKIGNEKIQIKIEEAVKKIHEKHFTRECPFCAEIIKKRAAVCKHCGKDVAGQ